MIPPRQPAQQRQAQMQTQQKGTTKTEQAETPAKAYTATSQYRLGSY